jgi:hypothetical protein
MMSYISHRVSVRIGVDLPAKMWEMFMIDFLAMKTGILRAIVGPYVSLWLVQSQGWPFQAVVWGLANQIFLAGTSDFVNHWLYFQDSIGVFNRENASGDVLIHPTYRAFLICTIVFGAATAVKRVILSNVIGKRLVGTWCGSALLGSV